ncbi:TolC family protein [Orrella marina]|uniref:TolC family protein n=1 Tax=Orrella marina TaxID=2163011 RepID=UPI002ACB0D6F|nr:TolC family protein [Orrella marina]
MGVHTIRIAADLQWGALQASLEQASAAQREAVATYQQSVEQAFREVSDALAGEATFSSQLDARSAQSKSAQRYYDLSNARFFNGIDSFLDVQVAQVELFNSRLQEVQTGFELLANRVNLYKALGGGWDESVPGATLIQSPYTRGNGASESLEHRSAGDQGETAETVVETIVLTTEEPVPSKK